MKMKRMEMQETVVGDYTFRIRPLGAMNAAYIFGDVAAVVLPIIGTVALSSGDEESADLDIFEGVDLDTMSLVTALSNINGKTLTRLISELLLEHSNVSFFDKDESKWRPMTEDDFDEIFCMAFAGALGLCAAVIQQNFSGFFGDIGTLFGRLMSAHKGMRLKNTESLTEPK